MKKEQIVIDVGLLDDGFVFSLHPKTKHKQGNKQGMSSVYLSYPEKRKFNSLSKDVLLMVVRMLCEGLYYWVYDLRFRNPVTGRTLVKARSQWDHLSTVRRWT